VLSPVNFYISANELIAKQMEVNNNFKPLLSNAVASIFSLLIIVRVEVDIVQNNDVSSTQVDAETTGLCRQQEDEDRGV